MMNSLPLSRVFSLWVAKRDKRVKKKFLKLYERRKDRKIPEDANITLFGKLPRPVEYELKRKYIPELQTWYEYNYIVLPLNTTLKKASDLCNDPKLSGKLKSIWLWDKELQKHIPLTPTTCGDPWFVDAPLTPGKSYRLTITSETNWTQK